MRRNALSTRLLRVPSPPEARGAPVDLAGREYWDRRWAATGGEAAGDSFRSVLDRKLEGYLGKTFGAPADTARTVLEVGCANSRWLPFFASELGYNVVGLDYSEVGCAQARALLTRAGVAGTVIHGDLFSPPSALQDAHDLVTSCGVVEHFEDTTEAVGAIGAFVRPGGRMLTLVPNLTGLIGSIQQRVNRPVYDLHVRLGPAQLATAHREAGFRVVDARFLLSTNFGVCNLADVPTGSRGFRPKRAALGALTRLSLAVLELEDILGHELPATRLFAPYVACLAERPRAEPDDK